MPSARGLPFRVCPVNVNSRLSGKRKRAIQNRRNPAGRDVPVALRHSHSHYCGGRLSRATFGKGGLACVNGSTTVAMSVGPHGSSMTPFTAARAR